MEQDNVVGKKMAIWKQFPSDDTQSLNSEKQFRAFIDAEITASSTAEGIRESCENEFGGYYAVVTTADDDVSACYTYNSKHSCCINKNGTWWRVWRQA